MYGLIFIYITTHIHGLLKLQYCSSAKRKKSHICKRCQNNFWDCFLSHEWKWKFFLYQSKASFCHRSIQKTESYLNLYHIVHQAALYQFWKQMWLNHKFQFCRFICGQSMCPLFASLVIFFSSTWNSVIIDFETIFWKQMRFYMIAYGIHLHELHTLLWQ